jgi:DNA sulfur modification protein DndC
MTHLIFGTSEHARKRKGIEPTRGQTSVFEGQRLTLPDSIDLTRQSLLAYAERYQHWCIAFSGGKDSTTVATAVCHLIATGQIPRPKTLTVLYADTRMELPPLHLAAMQTMAALRQLGVDCRVVLPPLDKRFFVYMLGRGVPPPNNNTLRWCTRQIKIEPMHEALRSLRAEAEEKLLMLTGVRIGESAARNQRIALSCGKNGAECGQGWFQETTPADIADTLAPILHWRVCHVWDWLTFEAPAVAKSAALVAEVYGGDEALELNARTGCIGCPLAEQDTALDYVISLPEWGHLEPLKRLRPLYRELRAFRHRKQKDGERNADGRYSKNPNRKGPLTLEAREWALGEVLAVQSEINAAAARLGRRPIDLINSEEEARIRELIAQRTYPHKWSDDDPDATRLIPQVVADGITQSLLIELEQ